jgi:hypothetical protein
MKLIVSSPRIRSRAARDAKWLLSGNNRYKDSDLPIHTYRGALDNVWSIEAGHAADRARFWLGYPEKQVNLDGRFFDEIYGYLLPRDNPRSRALPTTYRLRRAARIRAEKKRLLKNKVETSRKARALRAALSQVGYEEYPAGSNHQKFGVWFGFDRVAWCAIFVTWARFQAGATNVKTALAFQWEWWARARQHGLSITYNPEPGDIVVYHFGEGHVGFFRRWINRSQGVFEAVEGNTSQTSDDNGGKVMLRVRDTGSYRCVFCRWN